MFISRKIKKYAEKNFTGVLHTTLNPEGPGVVRLHMIPNLEGISVVIINGQDIIPVNKAWTILLCEFIKNLNEYDGREISKQDSDLILKKTCKAVRKIYSATSSKRIKNDINFIMQTFTQIAYRKPVDAEIEYLNIGEYAPYMTAPHRMDLLVSSMTKNGKWHCNQKCVHCYAAGQTLAEENELTTDEWKKIIDKCRESKIPQITFTGGEPTMRDDLLELIEYSKWFLTRLNTNGINLTKDFCHKLKEASLDSVQITFYSSDEKIHNQLVGAPKFEQTVQGIENAVEANLSLSINTPLCTLNKDYVKTLEFLHQKGVLYVTCSGLIITGNATKEDSEKLQLSSEEIKMVLKNAVEYCNKNGMEISFTSPGWIEKEFFEGLNINPPTCGACLSNMAITPNGNVVPCQSWLSGPVLGNMLKDDWNSIWENKICVERREYSSQMNGNCPFRKLNMISGVFQGEKNEN